MLMIFSLVTTEKEKMKSGDCMAILRYLVDNDRVNAKIRGKLYM